MTHDTWHLTHKLWQVTCDPFWSVNIPSSQGSEETLFLKKSHRISDWLNQLTTKMFVEQPRLHRVCLLFWIFWPLNIAKNCKQDKSWIEYRKVVSHTNFVNAILLLCSSGPGLNITILCLHFRYSLSPHQFIFFNETGLHLSHWKGLQMVLDFGDTFAPSIHEES